MAKSLLKNQNEATKLHAVLSEKHFGIKDIKFVDPAGSRPLHYWISLNLVGNLTSEEKLNTKESPSAWVKFSFYEFIWILTIQRLKELNYDNEILQKTAVNIFKKGAEDIRATLFEEAILIALTQREKPVVAFFGNNGEVTVNYDAEGVVKTVFDNVEGMYTFTSIALIVRNFLAVKGFFPYIKQNRLLNDREIQALEVLYNNPQAEIVISIEGKETVIKPGKEAAKKFIDTIMSVKYAGIAITL